MESHSIRKWLSRLALLGLILGLVLAFSVQAFASTQYENYTTDEDLAAHVYSSFWYSQTFYTDDITPHSVTDVKLRLYKTGNPGFFTVAIYSTIAGAPDTPYLNSPIASGTYDGDSLTGNVAGAWYDIPMTGETSLAMTTKYAIVIQCSLVTSDNANSVYWLYDDGDGAYADGSFWYKVGFVWTEDSGSDFMFDLYGNPSLEIYGANVFSNVYEQGDWYITVYYNDVVAPGYPNGDPKLWFNLYLSDSTNPVAQVKLPAWGHKPASIYLSAASVSALSYGWGSGYFGVVLNGTNKFVSPPGTGYWFVSTDWKGSDLTQFDSWVRTTAQAIETYYGTDLYTESVGGVTLPAGQGVLTDDGAAIFEKGMPGLGTLRPKLFSAVSAPGTIPTGTYTGSYQATLDYRAQLGDYVADRLDDWGGLLNITGKLFGGVLAFAMFVAVIGVGVAATGVPSIIAVVCAIPVALGSWFVGIWSLALAAVLSILVAMFTFYLMWLRGII